MNYISKKEDKEIDLIETIKKIFLGNRRQAATSEKILLPILFHKLLVKKINKRNNKDAVTDEGKEERRSLRKI